jgi:hypothetical protein
MPISAVGKHKVKWVLIVEETERARYFRLGCCSLAEVRLAELRDLKQYNVNYSNRSKLLLSYLRAWALAAHSQF